MQALGLAVGSGPELTVQDDLEHAVQHAGQAAVELIEEEDAGLVAGPNVPRRQREGGDTGFLRTLEVGVADDVTFGHRGGANVDELEVAALRELVNELGLANTVVAADEHRLRGREGIEAGDEGFRVHDDVLFLRVCEEEPFRLNNNIIITFGQVEQVPEHLFATIFRST